MDDGSGAVETAAERLIAVEAAGHELEVEPRTALVHERAHLHSALAKQPHDAGAEGPVAPVTATLRIRSVSQPRYSSRMSTRAFATTLRSCSEAV